MDRPHPMALRQRVIAFVEEGYSHRAAAARIRVSVKFVNDLVIVRHETGRLEPRRRGNDGGHGKLVAVQDWIKARMGTKPDLTLNDLVGELADRHGIAIHRVSVWRFLRGLIHEKRTCTPPNRSGLKSGRRAISGSRGVSSSCATCCPHRFH